jgi:cytochrome c oxidase cbb3-type subunit IV
MRRNVIESIQGIEIFPLISLVIFFVFFAILIIWVIRLKRKDLDEYSKMPLEEDEPHNQISNIDKKNKEVDHE